MWPWARVEKENGPSLAPYVVTPSDVVEEMLKLAEVRKDDLVYDLGSGDGRIVISAARLYGARGIGFELEPDLVRRAQDNARRAGVDDLVDFYVQDVMTVDLTPATVVTIYLSRDANLKLQPRLLSMLRPGSRVVSHNYDMGDWKPARVLSFRDDARGEHTLLLWRIPERPPGGKECSRLASDALVCPGRQQRARREDPGLIDPYSPPDPPRGKPQKSDIP